MTDKELKDLIASLALDRKAELESRKAELESRKAELESRKAADKDMEKLRKRFEATERMVKELSASVKSVCKETSGLSANIGHHAEQFFQNAFKKKLKFGNVKYDEMISNLRYKDNKDEIEFDIALINGNSIALIEVKNRIHPAFVDEFAEKRITKFRKCFPKFKNYAAYLGIAGFSFDEEVVARASRYGVGIIGQKGASVEVKGKLKAF